MWQITAQEQAFWDWWKSGPEQHQHLYNLRMAFDAGYDAGKNSL